MRVLHLSTTDIRGGAARGAYWLHKALPETGIDSHMLVGRKYSNDDCIHQLNGTMAWASEWLRGALDQLPLRYYRKTDDSFWTVGWVPRHLRQAIKVHKPDLIHLHWTGAGFLPIKSLRRLNYPIVWTLRDMWAFTGGCHYTAGCTRYQKCCGECPQLNSENFNDLSRHVWRSKKDQWKDVDLCLVPISRWLAGCAQESQLFAETPIRVIPNGVDTKTFYPVPRDEARAAWGLDPTKRYILFGALGALQDERKGYKQLVDAIGHLGSIHDTSRTELLVFGDLEQDAVSSFDIKARHLGHIDDDEKLVQLYAAADIMVVPSLQEAFGKTLIEAMACGTGVVAFASGGPADIVIDRETGFLARPFDPKDLAAGIAWSLASPERTAEIGRQARLRAEQEFDITVVARCYRDLYRSILKKTV